MAMENGPFIDDFPIKTSIYKGFSMAMLNNQRVYFYYHGPFGMFFPIRFRASPLRFSIFSSALVQLGSLPQILVPGHGCV